MERTLTEKEKNKIVEICGTEIGILGNYANTIKIIVPIFTFIVFIFLYSQIKFGTIWIYIGIASIISIIAIIEITKLQLPFKSIFKNNYSCFECEIKGSREKLGWDSHGREVYRYYITAFINGQSKEIEYKGKNFDRLLIGEKVIVISYNDIFKNKKYICFSKKELDEE